MVKSLDYYVESFFKSVTDFNNYLFFQLPGVNGPKFDKNMEKAKRLFVETAFCDERDWICMPIYGTTTSGDPAGTTLVNTFHSLMFDWLYIIEAFGI